VYLQESETDHQFVKDIIAKMNSRPSSKLPSDATESILSPEHHNGITLDDTFVRPGVTVQQFALALSEWAASHGHSTASTNDLLRILRDSVPRMNLPLGKKDKTPFTDKDITSNTISKYQSVDRKDFPTNVCRRECMAFRGQQFVHKYQAVVDCSLLLDCAVCGDPRYTKCSHKTCVKRGTEFTCSPFHANGHSVAYRVAMKTAFCRSIIIKLIELYCLSLMDGFHGILDYDNQRVKKAGQIIDILDGVEVQRQKQKMNKRFKQAKRGFKRQAPDLELTQCSLLLTAFYDGVVNFTRKADSMWPLMISVANCNPSHRYCMLFIFQYWQKLIHIL
jgi:hypothetical protein